MLMAESQDSIMAIIKSVGGGSMFVLGFVDWILGVLLDGKFTIQDLTPSVIIKLRRDLSARKEG